MLKTLDMNISSCFIVFSAAFLLCACQPEAGHHRQPEVKDSLQSSAHSDSAGFGAVGSSPRFSGIIAVGGRFSLGAAVGQDYVSELRKSLPVNLPLRNAAVKGEALSGLLQRLPHLLAQRPRVMVLELGEEDERRETAPSAFRRDLKRLSDALPGLQLIVLCTTQRASLRTSIHQFAGAQSATVLDFDPEKPEPETVVSALEPLILRAAGK